MMTGALVVAGLVTTGASQEAVGGVKVARAPTCTVSDCHSPVLQHNRVHQPLVENQCGACHVSKQGATPFQAGPRHEFIRAGDNPELCYACHDRLAENALIHEPVKMGVCTLCHDPHGSQHASLLRVSVDRQLCAQCHRVTFDQGVHVHPPVSDGTCGACHDPHGSDHQKLVRSAPPELCLDCHVTIEDLLDEVTVTHDAVTTGRSCLSCHDPHVSDFESLQKREPMELCLSCHDKELESGDGKTRNMAQYFMTHPNHHGPVRDESCSACHNAHGGDIQRLLVEPYPASPYAPFDEDTYALCFGCHDVEMVEEERDDEVTEFRNGDLNLHFVHVNREDKGCACSVCHDAHAGTGSMHIADPTAYGRKAILTKYEATATGGTCLSSCHAMWAYDRDQPVKNE